MAVCFLLTAGVTIAWMVFAEEVGASQEFLELVTRYSYTLEEARRFEKNYLLYGSTIEDALTEVETAQRLLDRARSDISDLIGTSACGAMERNLAAYHDLLEELSASRHLDATKQHDIERELRRNGALALDDAATLMDRERLRMHTMIRSSKIAALAGLTVVFLVLTLLTGALARQILGPLSRFVRYTQRIAEGDYSPIVPVRKIGDEFSNLAVAINRMLAQIKDHQSQLTRSARMAAVGTLTAGVAHELNNPLNNIGITIEAILEGYDGYDREQKMKMLNDIAVQVERASATVQDLLDFTRVDKPIFVPVALENVVDKCVGLVANEARLGGVEILRELPEDLPLASGNPRDLQQVFLNLFLNAIQAMPEGGTFQVRGSTVEPDMVRIDVIDSGIGIPEDHLGSIFEPFFTTKDVGCGTGLGLSVAYGIVQKHHGRLEVRSRSGVGSTFSVHLPCSSSDAGTKGSGTRET
jgi:signal transduction histidine kinase